FPGRSAAFRVDLQPNKRWLSSQLSTLSSQQMGFGSPVVSKSSTMSNDPRIDTYIAEAAPFAQPILKHLRKLIHTASPEITEDFKWSTPTYLYRGKLFCRTAAFKAHATLGFWH